MKYFIPIAALLLSTACHEQPAPATQSAIEVKDSIPAKAAHVVFVTYTSTELPGYLLSFKTSYELPDDPVQKDSSRYLDRHWLFVENKTTHDKDSLILSEITTPGIPASIQIKDVSEAFHFIPLLVEFTCTVESDASYTAYFSYTNDTLQMLFDTDGTLISIQRQDQHTLHGTIMTRVDNLPFSAKYAFSVSGSDHLINILKPDTEVLNYPGEARMDITAFRINNNKPVPYIIKEATKFRLDTFYRPANLLRVTVADSIPVYGTPEDILDYLTGNDAG